MGTLTCSISGGGAGAGCAGAGTGTQQGHFHAEFLPRYGMPSAEVHAGSKPEF